jgi:hypothetical protein
MNTERETGIAAGNKLIDEVVFFFYLVYDRDNLIDGRVAA